MAKEYSTEVSVQDSVYVTQNKKPSYNRKMKVYFSVPEAGVNSDTGILLLIAGFGGQANAKVYQKIRTVFSDEYNLVTVQCDYFGFEYLQNADPVTQVSYAVPDRESLKQYFKPDELDQIYSSTGFDYKLFLKYGTAYSFVFETKAKFDEKPEYFNDMGLLQSMDNIIAVLSVMGILYDNEYFFNSKRVILYGHSHGSFISYLCNRFAPGLFNLLIDNSGWTTPVYLRGRKVGVSNGNMYVGIDYDFIASKFVDLEMLDLHYLYNGFKNKCNILSFIGKEDMLVDWEKKKLFCERISNAEYIVIDKSNVDGIKIKSAGHGFDADFLEFFRYAYSLANIDFEKGKIVDLPERIQFRTRSHRYEIDYRNRMPQLIVR